MVTITNSFSAYKINNSLISPPSAPVTRPQQGEEVAVLQLCSQSTSNISSCAASSSSSGTSSPTSEIRIGGSTVLGFLQEINGSAAASARTSPSESSTSSPSVKPTRLSEEALAQISLEEIAKQLDFFAQGKEPPTLEECAIYKKSLANDTILLQGKFSPYQAARIIAFLSIPTTTDEEDKENVKKILRDCLQVLVRNKAISLLSGKEIAEIIYQCDHLQVSEKGMMPLFEQALLQEEGKKLKEVPAALLAELIRFFVLCSRDTRFFLAAEQELYRDNNAKLQQVVGQGPSRLTIMLAMYKLKRNGSEDGNVLFSKVNKLSTIVSERKESRE